MHYGAFMGLDKNGAWGFYGFRQTRLCGLYRCILACIGQNGLWGLYGMEKLGGQDVIFFIIIGNPNDRMDRMNF